MPIPNVADEAVFKEWDDRVLRATTTAASDRPMYQEAMGGVIAQTRSKRASKHSYDSPLPGVNTPRRGYTLGSDKGRPDLHELVAICTKLSDRILDLEREKDAQAVEILKLKNIIKKLERKAKSSIPSPKRRLYKHVDSSDDRSGGTKVFDDTTTVEKDVNAAEPVSTAGDAVTAANVIPDIDTAGPSSVSAAGLSTSTAGDIFEDEMMTIADTLVAIRSTRPRTTSVVIRDVEEEPRRATSVPTIQSQNKEQRIARERATEQEAKDAALIEQMEDVQEWMDVDILLAERLQ
ncbi:hypothetical protein Tco_0226980 [Tanacetum coccineum]